MKSIPDFDCKSYRNGSANILFKSYKDALETKKILDEKLENITVSNPVRRSMKKLDLVGLPYEVTMEEAMLALVKGNPSLGLSVKSDDSCSAGRGF